MTRATLPTRRTNVTRAVQWDGLPTPEMLRQVLRYDPETGELTWLKRDVSLFTAPGKPADGQARAWNSKMAGKPAFQCKNKAGHLTGRVFGKTMLAHRVAWAIHFGTWPADQIDHINGCGSDNRIGNLRDVSDAENKRNLRLRASNKSGVPGVFYWEKWSKWVARICIGGKSKHIGLFATRDEAVAARLMAERALGFHPNHGRVA